VRATVSRITSDEHTYNRRTPGVEDQRSAGGWPPPWPQVTEIVRTIPHTQWTLVGGLMVQLHAVHAGVRVTRPTRDVDMILHIETGATTFSGVRQKLERLGYELREPVGDGPVKATRH